jgi:putative sterol carrier protein
MVDATAQFFESLSTRGHEPLLEKTTGTMRIEVANGQKTDSWLLTVDHGDLEVSHRNAKADCTVKTRKEVFDGLARGEVNAMAAVLRGTLAVEGDAELLVLFQRLFPDPPRAAGASR